MVTRALNLVITTIAFPAQQQKAVIFFPVRFPIINAISLLPHVVFDPLFAYSYPLCSHLPHTLYAQLQVSVHLLLSPVLSFSPTWSVLLNRSSSRVSLYSRGPCPSSHAPRFCLLCTALLVRVGLLIRSAEFTLVHGMRQRELFPRISRNHGCRCPWPWPGSLLCTLLGWGVSWWRNAKRAFRVRGHYRWRWNVDACLKLFDSDDSNRLKKYSNFYSNLLLFHIWGIICCV